MRLPTRSDNYARVVRVLAAAIVVAALGACGGGGHKPNWAGWAEYLNKNVRSTPISVAELERDTGKPVCDPAANKIFLSQSGTTAAKREQAAAQVFFLCGKDKALAMLGSSFNGNDDAHTVFLIQHEWPSYGKS